VGFFGVGVEVRSGITVMESTGVASSGLMKATNVATP
jgi:hypothetical protein